MACRIVCNERVRGAGAGWPAICMKSCNACAMKINAPEGANRPGRVQSGMSIQRAAGFPPLAPIPLNANSLKGPIPNES
jgi:hypothetical protein